MNDWRSYLQALPEAEPSEALWQRIRDARAPRRAASRWVPAAGLAAAVALAAVVVVLRLLLGLAGRGGRRERPRDSAATAVVPGRDAAVPWAGSRGVALFLGAWAVAAVLAAYEVARVLNSPDSISQTFDAVFHLNAVRWILETGNADTLHFLVEAPKGGSLYPLGWHTSVALAMELIGSTDVPTAANAASLVVAGLIWTSGCLALSWRLFRARPAALAVTAVAAASFPAFPIVLVTFGVLYSNYLAVALLPAMLAGLIDLFPAHDEPRPPRLMLLIMVVAVGGLGLAQPNAVITFVLATALFLGVWLLRSITGFRHGGPRGQVAVRALTTVVALGVAYWLWVVLRPVRAAATWGATASTAQAVGEATLTAPGTTPVMWVPATLVIIGFAAAIKRHRLTWLATLHLITCFLYVAARSAGDASTRYSLVGTWYADVNRLSGLLPLTAVPLLTLGALVVLERASALVGRLRRPGRVLRGALAAGLCVWLLAAGVLSASMSKEVRHVESSYEFEPDSASLSDDEIALIRELPRYVPENAVIAVDPSSPFSGGALLGDRIRMTDSAGDPDVWIRTLASRGHRGGLSVSTPQAVRVLDAAGADLMTEQNINAVKLDPASMPDPLQSTTALEPCSGIDLPSAFSAASVSLRIFCGSVRVSSSISCSGAAG